MIGIDCHLILVAVIWGEGGGCYDLFEIWNAYIIHLNEQNSIKRVMLSILNMGIDCNLILVAVFSYGVQKFYDLLKMCNAYISSLNVCKSTKKIMQLYIYIYVYIPQIPLPQPPKKTFENVCIRHNIA